MAAKAKTADADEADAEASDGADKGAKKGGLPIKLIVMAVGGLVVLGGGGYGAYAMLKPKPVEKPAAPVVKPPVFVDLPEVLVNLANTNNDRTQYLKVKVVLELADQTLIQQIQPVMPRVMDAFQTYLRELRPTDLEGSAGLYRLKEELTRRVNASIAPNRINAVLFKEIVVQ